MKKQFSTLPIILLTGLITGCASTLQLEPQAQNVKVMKGAVPKGCQFRGNVGISEKDIYGPSHKDKQDEQINILRSQAVRLGANVVSITNHQTKYFPRPEYIVGEDKMHWELDAHAMSGKAYRCGLNTVNQSDQMNSISDVRPVDE